jgi:hypothetical protein
LLHSSIVNMKEIHNSENSANLCRNTGRNIPEGSISHPSYFLFRLTYYINTKKSETFAICSENVSREAHGPYNVFLRPTGLNSESPDLFSFLAREKIQDKCVPSRSQIFGNGREKDIVIPKRPPWSRGSVPAS